MSTDPIWDGVTPEDALLLGMRAERLKTPPAPQEADAPLLAAELRVGQEIFALPLASLRGCVPLRLVSPLPLAPPHVLGVVRFQGEIVTAFSLSMLLGGRGCAVDPFVLVMIALPGGRTVALDCEQIPVQVEIPRSEVARAAQDPVAIATPVVVAGLRLVNLVDVEQLAKAIRGGNGAG